MRHANTRRIGDAIRKRRPVAVKGGIVSTLRLIAIQVVLHVMVIMTNRRIIFRFFIAELDCLYHARRLKSPQ